MKKNVTLLIWARDGRDAIPSMVWVLHSYHTGVIGLDHGAADYQLVLDYLGGQHGETIYPNSISPKFRNYLKIMYEMKSDL